MQRPARQLIDVLNDIPSDLLDKVSPNSATLKYFIKLPMVCSIGTAAMQSGLTIMFLKLLTELSQSGDLIDHFYLSILMGFGMGLSGLFQLHMLNLAMKYYD